MGFLDVIRSWNKRIIDDPVQSVAKTLVEKQDLRQRVFAAPALFNRKTRRSVGLLSKLWRWDLNSSPETRRIFSPRYIRRHYNATAFLHPRTRRQRRHRARILMLSKRAGL